ncbi:glycosyltransferase family 9 protein [soil metagenome]
MERILVIKLSALGDFGLATGPMRRIREAHPGAHVTLLTTPPYAPLGEALGLFDAVWAEGRERSLGAWLRLARRLRGGRFNRVYDLHTSDRSSVYRLLFWPRFPQWSGIARGASHPHRNPDRDRMHTLERQAQQLEDAGIWPNAPVTPGSAPAADLSMLTDASVLTRLGVTAPFALLIPGASAKRGGKRWPLNRYVALATLLADAGLTPVVVGGPAEAADGRHILSAEPRAVSTAGLTSYGDLAALGAGAAVAVGNDTGPVHLVAAAGAPTLVLFGPESDPAICAPRGPAVKVLARERLADLDVDTVAAAALALARLAGRPLPP